MTVKPPDGSAQAADLFSQAHARLLADRTIQFELRPIEPEPTRQAASWNFDFLNSPVMTFIFWMIVAMVATAILYGLATRLLGWPPPWRRGVEQEPDSGLRPGQGLARQLLDEADQLARQGRFSEAAHLLLFRSVEDIDSRRPGLLRPALTSRDIAALPGLPESPRVAFARIAMMVERSLLAMRPLAQADWRECRAAYEEFAFADGWRG